MSILRIGYGIRFVGIERYMRYIEMRRIRMNVIDSRGQAIVELALVLFLLLLLVMGIFEFGRAMYIKNTLTHAARAGARAGVVTSGIDTAAAVTPDNNCTYPGTTGNDPIYKAACGSLYSGINKADVRIKVDVDKTVAAPTDTLNSGDMVKVTVSLVNVTSIVPNFITVLPNTLSGDTAMRYE
jgi:Flp pilus assembly protein TadG